MTESDDSKRGLLTSGHQSALIHGKEKAVMNIEAVGTYQTVEPLLDMLKPSPENRRIYGGGALPEAFVESVWRTTNDNIGCSPPVIRELKKPLDWDLRGGARAKTRAGQELAARASLPEVALGVMEYLGVKVKGIGNAFHCPIPGYEESKPSAYLWEKPGGLIMLHGFHAKQGGPKWWPLPDVFAAVMTGQARLLSPAERPYGGSGPFTKPVTSSSLCSRGTPGPTRRPPERRRGCSKGSIPATTVPTSIRPPPGLRGPVLLGLRGWLVWCSQQDHC